MRKLAALLGLVFFVAGIAATIAIADGANPSFTFSTDEQGATFQCSLDGAAPSNCSSPQNLSGLAPGAHTLTITSQFTVPQPPPPSPPTAAFSVSNATPAPGESVMFDGSASTCPAGGCTYYFHDVGSSGTDDWPLIGPGTANSGSFTFNSTGSKFVQLVVTDKLGQTATAQHTVTVTAPAPPPPTGSCDLNATPSTFTTQVAAVKAGQTLCLASGNYAKWGGGTSKAFTITAASGASPNICVDLSNTQNLTIDGAHTNYDSTSPGISSSCGNDIEGNSSNITIKNMAFSCNGSNVACLWSVAPSITVQGNVFHDMLYPNNATAAIEIYGGDRTRIIVKNNLFRDMGADAIDATGASIIGNDFIDVTGSNQNDPRHTDAIQFGSPGNIMEGNFVKGPCTQGIAAYDGATGNVIEDNVIAGCSLHSLVTAADNPGSLVDHNTVTDAGGLECGSKTGSPASTTQVRDNILLQGINWGGVKCTPSVDTKNMSSPTFGQIHSSTDLLGAPQFAGGASPGTYAGYALAAGSPGKGAASDGGDIGARVSLYQRPAGLP